MDNQLTPDQENKAVEDALKNYPLAPMPRSVTANVMMHIRKTVRPKIITSKDIALSLVISTCAGAVLFAIQNLPSVAVMEFRKQNILLHQEYLINSNWVTPAFLIGLAITLSLLTIPYLMTIDHKK